MVNFFQWLNFTLPLQLNICFRCNQALQACEAFHSRIPHDVQASKTADVWPVENLWGSVQMRTKAREPQSKPELKRIIAEEWRKINDALCYVDLRECPQKMFRDVWPIWKCRRNFHVLLYWSGGYTEGFPPFLATFGWTILTPSAKTWKIRIQKIDMLTA